MKKLAAKLFARYIVAKNKRWMNRPLQAQAATLKELIQTARNTQFGKDHHFDKINDYDSFKAHVPVRDYEGLRPYVEQIIAGELDVLWPGKPLYLSKTSGTTSGAKYIPISKESMPTHINAARDALLTYIHSTGKADFIAGNKFSFKEAQP